MPPMNHILKRSLSPRLSLGLRTTLIIFLAGFSLCHNVLGQTITPHSPAYGLHGMLLFGNNEGLYASHLPMFHTPHDYQVVLQIRIANQQLDAQIKKDLTQKIRLWTIEPEQFDITTLAPGANPALRQFKANIVSGHFEQGGKVRYKSITAIVERALIFRQLSPELHQSDTATYRQIGHGSHRFLLKEIDSRPDYDHVLAISTNARSSRQNILIKKSGISEPDPQTLQSALRSINGADARLEGNVYFDHADLE
ncbi:hypothetical protein [Undibacterium sp. RuTC16W]|uniref:hypothetical protein n=1 Tax=Undibacterium sp. RuTC16W TaxID=3413048 RepID=UPI003BF3908C